MTFNPTTSEVFPHTRIGGSKAEAWLTNTPPLKCSSSLENVSPVICEPFCFFFAHIDHMYRSEIHVSYIHLWFTVHVEPTMLGTEWNKNQKPPMGALAEIKTTLPETNIAPKNGGFQ